MSHVIKAKSKIFNGAKLFFFALLIIFNFHVVFPDNEGDGLSFNLVEEIMALPEGEGNSDGSGAGGGSCVISCYPAGTAPGTGVLGIPRQYIYVLHYSCPYGNWTSWLYTPQSDACSNFN